MKDYSLTGLIPLKEIVDVPEIQEALDVIAQCEFLIIPLYRESIAYHELAIKDLTYEQVINNYPKIMNLNASLSDVLINNKPYFIISILKTKEG